MDNQLEDHTKALPGLDASLYLSKSISSSLKIGIGVNYMQFREHITAVYQYTQNNPQNVVTTEIYNQDGTVEFITSLVDIQDSYERSISKVNKKKST